MCKDAGKISLGVLKLHPGGGWGVVAGAAEEKAEEDSGANHGPQGAVADVQATTMRPLYPSHPTLGECSRFPSSLLDCGFKVRWWKNKKSHFSKSCSFFDIL